MLDFPTLLLVFPTKDIFFTRIMSKKEGKILIVDDNRELLVALSFLLKPHFEEIQTETNPNLIPSLLKSKSYDLILLDMNFSAGVNSGNEGIYWMNKILKDDPQACVVLITAFGDVELAVKSVKEGAIDFIQKSWDEDKILSSILSAYQIRKSRMEIKKLQDKQDHLKRNMPGSEEVCFGFSEQMKKILETIDKVAATDANILILGENGTGKEILAREIHNRSSRKDELFVKVDVTSIPESLFESELFGHTKGAFTDASNDRAGRMELASGGTLFLDEIGDLGIQMQPKLLSALQNNAIVPVGSNVPTDIDARIICATNKDIEQLISEKLFREDLLYRINTIEIKIPPLRERPEDIPELIRFFLEKYSCKYDKQILHINEEAIKYMQSLEWKGNIRELQHFMEKTVILTDKERIELEDIKTTGQKDHAIVQPANLNLSENEKRIIFMALKKNEGNVSRSAKELGINRTTLYEKMKKYDL